MAVYSSTGGPGLYVHVPFCARKCEYCAFYSTAADGEVVRRYVEALIVELGRRAPGLSPAPATLFFGGGTPSLLNLRQWEAVVRAVHDHRLGRVGEWTVECNPATVSLDKARLLRDAGVTRISMGVQSFHEPLLDRLGRVHSRDMVFRSFDLLRQAGFDNVNLDLMFAIPGQTMAIWRETLREAIRLGSEHLSCYEVIYEEDTPLFAQLQAGEVEVDEELAADQFEALVDEAGAAGFVQYEIANFAREPRVPDPDPDPDRRPNRTPGGDWPRIPSFACRHNVNYWRGGAYAGLGPGASGFENGERYRNLANTALYCERIERGESTVDWSERLPPLARAGEIAAFGLRMNAGWPWISFLSATGFDLRTEWAEDMQALVDRGWGVLGADGFRLTPAGLRFADEAGSGFLRSPAVVGTTRRSDTRRAIGGIDGGVGGSRSV